MPNIEVFVVFSAEKVRNEKHEILIYGANPISGKIIVLEILSRPLSISQMLKNHRVRYPKITGFYLFGPALSFNQIMIFPNGNFSRNNVDCWCSGFTWE